MPMLFLFVWIGEGKTNKKPKEKGNEKGNATKKETGHTVLTGRIPQDGVHGFKFSFVLFGLNAAKSRQHR